MAICTICGCIKELCPYGHRGAFICFDCAMTPGRKAETERNFDDQLKAAGSKVLIGLECGPIPLTKEGYHD